MNDSDFKRVNGKFANVNGIKMYYEVYGDGYPLILIHGGISSIQMWNKQIPVLSHHFKVIAVDCRGQGRTDNPTGEFHYKQMADDFAAFIRELKLDKVLLCGWSDGAQIGLEMGMHYPELIKAMVLGGTLLHVSQEMIDGFKAIGVNAPGEVDFEKLEKSLPWLVKLLKEHQSYVYGEDYWKTLLEKISIMWFDPDEFPGDKVKSIETPSLVLLGDRDDYIPISEAIKIHELMPNTELAILPNANHDAYDSYLNIFNQIVINYLARHTKEKKG
ncbi:MAG: alpha/beta hydrolase [Asgard group archaeon]|nr:alpha/beta hydrolase [Asgard group archaeon]